MSGPQLLDTLRINIKADDRHPGSRKRDGDWQSDVAETNNSELPAVTQNYGPLGCAARLQAECPFILRLLEILSPEIIQIERENQNLYHP
jgi:hypothetical protein